MRAATFKEMQGKPDKVIIIMKDKFAKIISALIMTALFFLFAVKASTIAGFAKDTRNVKYYPM